MKVIDKDNGDIYNAHYTYEPLKDSADLFDDFGHPVNKEDIRILSPNDVDWEQRRFELVKAILPAVIADRGLSGNILDRVMSKYNPARSSEEFEEISTLSILLADTVINDLNNGTNIDNFLDLV